jgi:YCII-related domain
MAKFVYIYTGGQMSDTPEAQEAAMQAWGAWFGTLGEAVTDGGNPFAGSLTVSPNGVTEGGSAGASGYTIVAADSLEEAAALAKGCPVLTSGGAVEVYEAIPM